MDDAELFLKIQEKLDEKDISCTVCLSTHLKYRTMVYPCFHQFCGICLFQWTHDNDSCPVCRNEMEKIFFNVQLPTSYKTLDFINFPIKEKFRSHLIRKYYAYIIEEDLKDKNIDLLSKSDINLDIIASYADVYKAFEDCRRELHFAQFCFNESYLPVINVDRPFSFKEYNNPERCIFRVRLKIFLTFYLSPYQFAFSNIQTSTNYVDNSLTHRQDFDEFLLDFKLNFLEMSEYFTPYLPYNFTKRLEYEFFAFALSKYDDYHEYFQHIKYRKTSNFNGDYEELIRIVKSSTVRDRANRTLDDVIPAPIHNVIRVSPKQIHEFRRYIRLALSSDHWFKHLVRFIINKFVPGQLSILDHSAFKYLEPFVQRIMRVRSIIDLDHCIYERQLLRLLVHENKTSF